MDYLVRDDYDCLTTDDRELHSRFERALKLSTDEACVQCLAALMNDAYRYNCHIIITVVKRGDAAYPVIREDDKQRKWLVIMPSASVAEKITGGPGMYWTSQEVRTIEAIIENELYGYLIMEDDGIAFYLPLGYIKQKREKQNHS